MDPIEEFKKQVSANIDALGKDKDVQGLSRIWTRETNRCGYTYNFSWLGRPIIQYPQDMVALQEIIWAVKPDLIIETGIAHGGSLIFSASILGLISACGGGNGEVLGVDIEIREHNRKEIEAHPLSKRISMLQGSSIDPDIISKVYKKAEGKKRIIVILDSNHTHQHVLAELNAYAHLTSVGSYCVVFDTLVEDMPADMFPKRPWGPGDNPKTAVWEFLKKHKEFQIDKTIQDKLLITVAPDGYLKRIS